MEPIVVVVMGVSGSGKSTIAELLSRRLGWHFAEADEFHSPANVEKMRSGVALTDEDRAPWLAAIAAHIDVARASETPTVVTCSALKRRYRDVIVGSRPDVALVYLKGDYETIAARMSERSHAYMPVSLLKSQFDALEEPGADEHPIVEDVSSPPQEIVERILAALRDPPPPARG